MEGAGRIFARELGQSRLPLPGPEGGVLSPTNLACTRIFVAGALVELVRKGPDLWIGRVADPSGVFRFRTIKPDSLLKIALEAQETPSFVTMTCQVLAGAGDPPGEPVLVLLDIRAADRAARDTWVMRTAELTIGRLSRMKEAATPGCTGHPGAAPVANAGPGDAVWEAMAAMVSESLAAIEKSTSGRISDQDVHDRILAYIREHAGSCGISLEAISAAAGEWGIDATRVRDAMKALAEEDECYQPSVGVFKPL